jgi:hypothetical protein
LRRQAHEAVAQHQLSGNRAEQLAVDPVNRRTRAVPLGQTARVGRFGRVVGCGVRTPPWVRSVESIGTTEESGRAAVGASSRLAITRRDDEEHRLDERHKRSSSS